MRTAIRSSTFWWTLIFMVVVIAPARAFAAGAPTPTPTPSGPSYFVTWSGTAKGIETDPKLVGCGKFGGAGRAIANAFAQGSALVKFGRFGPVSVSAIRVSQSYEYDCKLNNSLQHLHESVVKVDTDPVHFGSSEFFWTGYLNKRADGTWEMVVRPVFPESCLRTEIFQTSGPCVNGVCPEVQGSRSYVIPCNRHAQVFAAGESKNFVLEANTQNPDYFSKHAHFVDTLYETGAPVKSDFDWTITARRIGKCRIPGEIPLNDNPVNPDINDEDVEMGVEHGSDSIDPDSGVAALNLRVTCDQVPIKNARVKVRVVALGGGHLHKNNFLGRPYGSLKWNGVEKRLTDDKPSIEVKTDDDGRAHLTFKAGKAMNHDNVGIAGIYRITATSMRFPMRRAEVRVEAKVDGLSPIDVDSNLVDDVRGASHISGDYATAPTKSKLVQFAKDFHDAQDKHNREDLGACPWPNYPLWVVDVSLPDGGLYDDIDDDWATPHQTHGHGDGVDFSVKERSDSPSSATKWPPASATTGSNSRWVGAKLRSTSSPACPAVDQQGWLITTMLQSGAPKYGHWDPYDLCQHPNVCPGPTAKQPWVDCCPDNRTCPTWGPGMISWGPGMIASPGCPGGPYPAAQCLHCPTPVRYHLHVDQ